MAVSKSRSSSTESSSSSSSNSDDSKVEPERSQNKNKYIGRKRSISTSSTESRISKKSKLYHKTINKSQYKRSRSDFSEESWTDEESSYEDVYRKPHQKSSRRRNAHEILPEDDPSASRILYIGNLDSDITSDKLHTILERYGHVIRVDLRTGKLGDKRMYAFAKLLTLDMAYKAKTALTGQFLTEFRCKIGYGKPTPTARIWIGGLEPSITTSQIKAKFRNFGEIIKIDHSEGDDQCYIRYDSIEAASKAIRKMRGFSFAGSERRLRTDFADLPPNKLENRRSGSIEGHNFKNFDCCTVQDIIENCSMVWQGDIIINDLPETIAMHLIEGNQNIVDEFMKNEDDELQLTVLPRYNQGQFKLDQVERGLSSGSSHAIFLAASVSENVVSSERKCGSYLTENKAVGAVNLINWENFTYGSLLIFPPCTFSIGLLKRTCPNLSEESITDDYKIIVGLRGY